MKDTFLQYFFSRDKTWDYAIECIEVATDGYMNLQLASTKEFIDGAPTRDLGEVVVRWGNIIREESLALKVIISAVCPTMIVIPNKDKL